VDGDRGQLADVWESGEDDLIDERDRVDDADALICE
jgi:hypothetical protein